MQCPITGSEGNVDGAMSLRARSGTNITGVQHKETPHKTLPCKYAMITKHRKVLPVMTLLGKLRKTDIPAGKPEKKRRHVRK